MPDIRAQHDALVKTFAAQAEVFSRAIQDTLAAQKHRLFTTLRANRDTDFGREHRFGDLRSIEEFQSAVPIRTYAEYQEPIARIAQGEQNVLTASPVLMLEPTSGSTAASKLIPYTAELREEFRCGIFPWLHDLLSNTPGIDEGRFYWSVTPAAHIPRWTDGGLAIGFGDDTSYFTSEQAQLLNSLSAVPFSISAGPSMERFKRETLTALAAARDLTFISVWNPTFLTCLLDELPQHLEHLLSGVNDSGRRSEIARYAQTQDTALLWPKLRLISCWTDASAAMYRANMQERFPHAEIQGKGLLATEGCVTFPIRGIPAPVLAINSHFFEFREVGQDAGPAETALAHELAEGRRYEVIITTGGGLYRYNLADIVEVVGYHQTCPMLRFLGRSGGIADSCGEKLDETHVLSAAAATFRDCRIAPRFFLLAPESEESSRRHHYVLFLDAECTEEQRGAAARGLDDRLRENYHYDYCRNLGQLGPLQAYRIDGDGPRIYLDLMIKEGHQQGSVKPAGLSGTGGWDRAFPGGYTPCSR